MKKAYQISGLALLLLCIAQNAHANSSWHWYTDGRPYQMLPIAVICTLVAEILMIKKLGTVQGNWRRTVIVVVLANLASFLAQPLFLRFTPGLCTFQQTLDNLPTYIIMFGYLFLTLTAEVPIVLGTLWSRAQNKRRLVLAVLLSNAITTFGVALIERLIFPGAW